MHVTSQVFITIYIYSFSENNSIIPSINCQDFSLSLHQSEQVFARETSESCKFIKRQGAKYKREREESVPTGAGLFINSE